MFSYAVMLICLPPWYQTDIKCATFFELTLCSCNTSNSPFGGSSLSHWACIDVSWTLNRLIMGFNKQSFLSHVADQPVPCAQLCCDLIVFKGQYCAMKQCHTLLMQKCKKGLYPFAVFPWVLFQFSVTEDFRRVSTLPATNLYLSNFLTVKQIESNPITHVTSWSAENNNEWHSL